MTKLTNAQVILKATFKSLPSRLRCPKCGRTRGKEFFGLRVAKKDPEGLPILIYRQSYCRDCRG
jgi:hypothetical protein